MPATFASYLSGSNSTDGAGTSYFSPPENSSITVGAAVADLGNYYPASVTVNTGAGANCLLIAILRNGTSDIVTGGLTWYTLFSGTGFKVVWAKSATPVNTTFAGNDNGGTIITGYSVSTPPDVPYPGYSEGWAHYSSTGSIQMLVYTDAYQGAPVYTTKTGSAGTKPNCDITTTSTDSEAVLFVASGAGYGSTLTNQSPTLASGVNRATGLATYTVNAIAATDPGYSVNSSSNWSAYALEILPAGSVVTTYTRINISSSGKYRAKVRFVGAVSANNTINWKLYKNNTVDLGVTISGSLTAGTQYDLSDEDVVALNEGDHVNLRIWRGVTATDITGTLKVYLEKVS